MKALPQELPLSPVEELMLHQDCPAYPYVIFIRLEFAGELAQEPFEAAVSQAIQRHPLLAAKIDSSRRRPHWQIPAALSPRVVWTTGEIDGRYPPVSRLQVGDEPLRVVVRRSASASELVLQLHHARCDGLGIYQFIEDLLLLYAIQTGSNVSKESLAELDETRLAGRGGFGLTTSKLLRMLPDQLAGLAGVRQYLMRNPTPMVPHEREPAQSPTSAPYPATATYQFDRETSTAIGKRARAAGVTANDLLCRDLFQAIHAFRKRRGTANGQQWLRLMVPVSLRNKSDALTPAANIVSTVFLDRQEQAIGEPTQLLTGINEEMQLIKNKRLGFTFVFSLHANRWLPGGLRKAASGDKCSSTAIFSNLGRVLARTPLPQSKEENLICGDVELLRTDALAPLTPFTCAAFCASWYAKRLAIALHYDPRPLSREDADELLALFVEEIKSSVTS